MRVLIADDEPVSRRLLEETLLLLGHDVVAVADGAQAAEQLLAVNGPRVAILDWMMPGVDGLEICRRLRQRATPYTYVILLTSRDSRADMLAALDAGVDDFLVKPCDIVELRIRLRSGERILDLQEHLLETQAALRFEAAHDRLTGLWNRGSILDHLSRELNRACRVKVPVGVLLADLDHFKRVNDGHGHAAGDIVLCEAGVRMREALREYDAVGRYGGEEFLMVVPGATMAEGRDTAERIRAAIAARPMLNGTCRLTVTTSIGVASTASCGYDVDALVRDADIALYRAKREGRDRVAV